jgi:hypothetical protein
VVISPIYLSRSVRQNTRAVTTGNEAAVQGNFQALARVLHTDREMGQLILEDMSGEAHRPLDGRLLVAGQAAPSPSRVGHCLNGVTCEGAYPRVARVDPASLDREGGQGVAAVARPGPAAECPGLCSPRGGRGMMRGWMLFALGVLFGCGGEERSEPAVVDSQTAGMAG